jgi:16S rRNA (guanine527-N7)-methyltransferase
MQPEALSKFNVSRETQDKLKIYEDLLFHWQKAINLVGKESLHDAYNRHFLDSLQIAPLLIKQKSTLADMGSGAGFPGLVLAIACPWLDVHLIESDSRKVQFLRTVSRETVTPVQIHENRIESVIPQISPNMVTARALAPLDVLFKYSLPWAVKNLEFKAYFLKGKGAEEEIKLTRKDYDFELQAVSSITSPEARILCISLLKKREQEVHK